MPARRGHPLLFRTGGTTAARPPRLQLERAYESAFWADDKQILEADLLRRHFLDELRRDSNNWFRFHGLHSTIHSDGFLVERLQLINLRVLPEALHNRRVGTLSHLPKQRGRTCD